MAARFKFNGTNNAALPASVSPDTGSGAVLVGDGSSIVYSTTYAYEGTSSVKGTGSQVLIIDDDGSFPYTFSSSDYYVDFFAHITAAPGSDTLLLGYTAGAFITTDRRLAFKDSGGTTRGQSSANLIPTNAWFRVRARIDNVNGLDQVYVWTTSLTDNDPVNAGATSILATANVSDYVCLNTTSGSGIYFDDLVVQLTSEGNPTHPTTTTHTAAAAITATATLASTASKSTSGDASRSTTATLTATGTVERFAAAASSTTATLTATATREAPGDAASTVTATLTASADVTPAAGTHYAEAALTATATLAATAAVDRFADAALTVTATQTATGARETFAAASLTVTATRTATGSSSTIQTTPGTMRAVDLATATMRPGTSTQVPRMAAIVGVDAATMTLLISTTTPPAAAGIAVFYGGDESPEDAGLIAAGTPYLWITEGTVYYEDGS